MILVIDLTTRSQGQEMSKNQESGMTVCDHAVASLSKPVSCPDLVKNDSRKFSPSSSSQQDAAAIAPHSDSEIETHYDPARHRFRQHLPRLCKSSARKAPSEDVGARPRNRERIVSKKRRSQTKEIARSRSQSKVAERIEGSNEPKLGEACQSTRRTRLSLVNSSYQEGEPDQSVLALSTENVTPQLTEDEDQRASSPDMVVDSLPLVSKLQASVTPQEFLLPTPPSSDIGSGQVESSSDGVPSYRFVPIPRCPVEGTGSLRTDSWPLQTPVASTCSISRSESKSLGPSCQKGQAVSFSKLVQTTKFPDRHSIQRATPPAKKALLNLVWQDIGNGISRAYPRHDLPPSPAYSEPPMALESLTEGLDYFFVSDRETDRSQDHSKEGDPAKNATKCRDRLLSGDVEPHIPLKLQSSRREPIEVFSSDSEPDIEIVDLKSASKAVRIPSYTFTTLPKSCIDHASPIAEPNDGPVTLDSNTHTTNDTDSSISSNVQPTHLTPHRKLSASASAYPPQPTKIEYYNPNTSSGFSDTEAESRDTKGLRTRRKNHKKNARRERNRRIRRARAAKIVSEVSREPETPSSTRISVVRAAERLVKLAGRKNC